jgi:hypothetical protein
MDVDLPENLRNGDKLEFYQLPIRNLWYIVSIPLSQTLFINI